MEEMSILASSDTIEDSSRRGALHYYIRYGTSHVYVRTDTRYFVCPDRYKMIFDSSIDR